MVEAPKLGRLWLTRSEAIDLGARPAAPLAKRVQRGDYIHAGESRARFVGVSPMGVVWCAYANQDYSTMCARFDARWGHV